VVRRSTLIGSPAAMDTRQSRPVRFAACYTAGLAQIIWPHRERAAGSVVLTPVAEASHWRVKIA
jgi:hypothetical protein